MHPCGGKATYTDRPAPTFHVVEYCAEEGKGYLDGRGCRMAHLAQHFPPERDPDPRSFQPQPADADEGADGSRAAWRLYSSDLPPVAPDPLPSSAAGAAPALSAMCVSALAGAALYVFGA